jgi:hypothetical protein
MATERDIVALLHRADWTRLSLSGVVHGSSDESELLFLTEARSRPFPGGPPFPPPWGPELTLLLAPGRRYRLENADGRRARGCDGERIWEWFAELPPETEVRLGGGPRPPFPILLAPSWLLYGYSLAVGEETTACGRPGVRLAATALSHPKPKRMPGIVPMMLGRRPLTVRYDHVVAIVDAELGILLRCEGWREDHEAQLTEFRTLTAEAEIAPARFAAPEGSVVGDGSGSKWPFGEAGKGAAKTVAGLAAGGLGAAIKYAPRKRQDPFARATEEDPEAAMPRDDPAPDPGMPVSDEILHVLYRSGASVLPFTATLHQWLDLAALLEAVPESARKAGLGGAGLLVDVLRDSARDAGAGHIVYGIRIGGWEEYRIDRIATDSRGARLEPLTLACDGRRCWEVYAEHVVVGPSGALPDEITDFVNGSWLLGCDLSGGSEVMAGGRRGYRVAVSGPLIPVLPEAFSRFPIRAVAVVDAESGRLLRLTHYMGGKPVVRAELRDIVADESDDFGFSPPAGLRVVEKPADAEPTPPNPVESMTRAARGFLGALRGRTLG